MSGTREKLLGFLGRRAAGGEREPISFAQRLLSPRKILVVPTRGAKGFAFAVPSLGLLRDCFPKVELHVLADAESFELFESDPLVSTPHAIDDSGSWRSIPQLMSAGRTISEEQFDYALWLDEEVDSERRLAVMLAARHVRVGRAGAEPAAFFNCQFRYPQADLYAPLAQLALTKRACRRHAQARLRWSVAPKQHEHARQLIHFWKPKREHYLFVVDPGRSVCGVAPGVRKLAMIVEVLKRTYPCRILIASDPGSEEAVAALLKETARWDPLQIPRRSLVETTALLGQSQLLVSANTTLFHFAWSLGIPSIGLFSKADDARFVPPPGGPSVVVRSTDGLEAKDFLQKIDRLLIGFSCDRESDG